MKVGLVRSFWCAGNENRAHTKARISNRVYDPVVCLSKCMSSGSEAMLVAVPLMASQLVLRGLTDAGPR